MNDVKAFYALMVSPDVVWSLKDAVTMMLRYNKSLLDADDISSTTKIKSLKEHFTDSIDEFTDKIEDYPQLDIDGFPMLDEYAREVRTPDLNKTKVNKIDFIKWAVGESIPLPPEIMDIIKGSNMGIENEVSVESKADNLQQDKLADDNNADNRGLMLKYALTIGAYCNENNNDDYTPTFDDVVDYLAGVYGKNVVPDYWVKEILSCATDSMVKKDGRPKKVLEDAIRIGFCMREWYQDNNEIDEIEFKAKFKKDLPKAAVNLRSKAWQLLTAYKTKSIM
jgi:hypothetical protein